MPVPPIEELDEIEIALSSFQSKMYDLILLEKILEKKAWNKKIDFDEIAGAFRKGRILGKTYLNLFKRYAQKKRFSGEQELELEQIKHYLTAARLFNQAFEKKSIASKKYFFKKNNYYKLHSFFSLFIKPAKKQKTIQAKQTIAKEKPKNIFSKNKLLSLFVEKENFEEKPVEFGENKQIVIIEEKKITQQKQKQVFLTPKDIAIQEQLRKTPKNILAEKMIEEQTELSQLKEELPSFKQLVSNIFVKKEKKPAPKQRTAAKAKKKQTFFSSTFSTISKELREMLYSVFSGEEKTTGLGEIYVPEEFSSIREKFFAGAKEHLIAAEQENKDIIWLIPGYAYAQAMKEETGNQLYFVSEPILTELDKKLIDFTKKKLIEKITIDDLNREKFFEKVEQIIKKEKFVLSDEQKEKIVYYLSRDLFGLGKIEPLMHDPFIEDIECDGTGIPIFLVHRKFGHLPTNIIHDNVSELEDFVIKLAQLSKSYVSYASPLLDSILPDGSRVNAVLTQSVSTKGPTFTIRRFPEEPFSPIQLLEFETIPAETLAYLWTAIEYKKSILISGPTAAGKTTILNALAMFFPEGERVVSIEDTRELNIEHENWLPQVSREGFGPPDQTGQRFGEVTLMDLIKESFRQRPDYLVVGEVRGEETYVMFQGMASGHTCLATMHARSIDDLVNRLITPPINLYPTLLESLDIVLIMGFYGTEKIQRSLVTLGEIERYNAKTGKLEFNRLYSRTEALLSEKTEQESAFPITMPKNAMAEALPITARSQVLKEIAEQNLISAKKLQAKISDRTKFLEQLKQDKVFNYKEFAKRFALFKQKEREQLKLEAKSR